jgi:hypothetical protein
LTCLSPDPVCIQETNHLKEDDLRGMIEEDMQSGLNEEVNQEHHDYIEHMVLATIRSHHSFIFHYFLTSSLKQLVLHVLWYTLKIISFKPEYECISTPITHMVTLEIFLHVKYGFLFLDRIE